MLLNVVLEETLESPLDCEEIQPVNTKGKQSWIFIGRTDAEAETPILWPPDAKNWLLGKTVMLGKTDGRRRRGRQRMRWLDGITDSIDMGLGGLRESWWRTGRPGGLRFMGSQRVGHDWETELNWTELQISSFVWHSSVFLSVSYSACITYFTFKIQGIIQTSSITLRQMTKMENITTYIQSILIYLIHKSSYKSREKIWTS